MLKRNLVLALISITGILWALPINVKTLGAVGDGVADDTDAIQKAFHEAALVEFYDKVAVMGGSFGSGRGQMNVLSSGILYHAPW